MTYHSNKDVTIAEKLRKLLLNIDLKIVYAEGEMKVAEEDCRLNSKIDNSKNQQLAISAKARKECYRIYIANLVDTKQNIRLHLDKVLSKYLPTRKMIWEKYFLERKSIEKIANEVSYSVPNVKHIIKQLRADIEKEFSNEENEKNL